jgi:hypothetical protein
MVLARVIDGQNVTLRKYRWPRPWKMKGHHYLHCTESPAHLIPGLSIAQKPLHLARGACNGETWIHELGMTVLAANSGGWLGQTTTQMNHVMTWRDFDATEQCDVARMDDVMTSAFAVHLHSTALLDLWARRPDKLLERIWSSFDAWIIRGSLATHKNIARLH